MPPPEVLQYTLDDVVLSRMGDRRHDAHALAAAIADLWIGEVDLANESSPVSPASARELVLLPLGGLKRIG